MITDLDIGLKSSGEKNFIESLYEPYTDYLDEPFPSGEVENISFIFQKYNIGGNQTYLVI